MFAADFGTGEVFWSFLWFFLFFMWLWLIIVVFSDIFRAHDMSGWAKAIWAIVIIFVPFLGVFLYLIVNGGKMSARAAADAKAMNTAQQEYIRSVASGSSEADQLAKLADLHTNGRLTDAEYAQAKAKLISS